MHTSIIARAVLAVLLLSPAMLPAQNIPKDLASDFKYGARDILAAWAAQFHASARGYAIGAASLGVVGLSVIADDNAAAWIRAHPDAGVMRALKPFRERGR